MLSVVNVIKVRALHSGLFEILCNEMGSDHDKLLLHTEVSKLLCGKVMCHVFYLTIRLDSF
jgi:hypothetical protein